MYIHVLLEDVYQSHHGHDLFDGDKCADMIRKFKQKKTDTVSQLLDTLSEALVSYIYSFISDDKVKSTTSNSVVTCTMLIYDW